MSIFKEINSVKNLLSSLNEIDQSILRDQILIDCNKLDLHKNLIQSLFANEKLDLKDKPDLKVLQKSMKKIVRIIESKLSFIDGEENIFDYRSQIIFELRKRLIDLEVLSYKGYREYYFLATSSILSELKQLECYEEIVGVLYKHKIYLKIYQTKSSVLKINKQIEYYEMCSKALSEAADIYLNCLHHHSPELAITKTSFYYQEKIIRLKELQSKSKSKIIYYYQLMVECVYSNICKKYNESLFRLNDLEEILLKHKSIYSHGRMYQVLINKSYVLAKTFDFENAFLLIGLSRGYTMSKFNLAIGEFILASIEFYSNKIFDSVKRLDSISEKFNMKGLPIIFTQKCWITMSTIHFVKGDYTKSLDFISKIELEENDREGWYLFSKVLRILIYIESCRFDDADYLIENFRKLIERENKICIGYDRFVLIKKALVIISHAGYNYKVIGSKLSRLIKLLDKDDGTKWCPLESEVIPINFWLEAKIDGKNYDHEKAMMKMITEK